MKIKANTINLGRKDIDKEINKLWLIIYTNNVLDKKLKRKYNLYDCLTKINKLAEKRIKNKLYSVMINCGLSDFKKFKENSIYSTIYELSEKSEMYNRLKLVKTLKPTSSKNKLKKYSEELSYTFINDLRNKLKLETLELSKKLDELNNKFELEIPDDELNIAV